MTATDIMNWVQDYVHAQENHTGSTLSRKARMTLAAFLERVNAIWPIEMSPSDEFLLSWNSPATPVTADGDLTPATLHRLTDAIADVQKEGCSVRLGRSGRGSPT